MTAPERPTREGPAVMPALSALVVVRNEERQLAECLGRLEFADEIVVVLDRCTDRSKEIAERLGARVLEGGHAAAPMLFRQSS